jgi:uncharacterized protein
VATVIHGGFEWDSEKAEENIAKHGVTFEEGATVFAHPASEEYADITDPTRFVTIGFSGSARLLLVVSTERNDRTRVISVRKANKHEQAAFGK